jgi:DNA-binding NtrC family response regulator
MAATVWVVDDEESVRDVVGAMLKELGYDVRLFGQGQEIIEAYRNERCDVIITDVRMPGMSGMEVTRSILEINPDAVVMILTGFPSIPDAVEAIKTGATDFLSKPCRMEEIRVRIERALESRDMYGRLRKARLIAWILIGTLPLWFILGILLARMLQG